jgi:hypothetical protein
MRQSQWRREAKWSWQECKAYGRNIKSVTHIILTMANWCPSLGFRTWSHVQKGHLENLSEGTFFLTLPHKYQGITDAQATLVIDQLIRPSKIKDLQRHAPPHSTPCEFSFQLKQKCGAHSLRLYNIRKAYWIWKYWSQLFSNVAFFAFGRQQSCLPKA